MPKKLSPKRAQRIQGRKKRVEKRQFKRKVRNFLIFSGLGTLGFLIVIALIIPSIPGPETNPNVSDDPGQVQPGMKIDDLGRGHFAPEETAGLGYYNSDPPTSGMHSPTYERCGMFDSPLPDEVQVHNLEHGFVLVQYNETDEGFIDQLTDATENLPGWPNYYILAPNQEMEHKIALTAWGGLAYIEEVDNVLMNDFAKAYRGRGPESGTSPCQPSSMLE